MSEARQQLMTEIPFEQRALNAAECGALFGKTARTFLETVACKPGFPKRVSLRPAAWIAKHVLEWREEHIDELSKAA